MYAALPEHGGKWYGPRRPPLVLAGHMLVDETVEADYGPARGALLTVGTAFVARHH